MLYTVIIFVMTLAELAAAISGYVLESKLVFTHVVIYGSPVYMITNLLNSNSPFAEHNPLYQAMAVFHLVKYLAFVRSQIIEDRNILRSAAIAFEGIYLGVSAYYII